MQTLHGHARINARARITYPTISHHRTPFHTEFTAKIKVIQLWISIAKKTHRKVKTQRLGHSVGVFYMEKKKQSSLLWNKKSPGNTNIYNDLFSGPSIKRLFLYWRTWVREIISSQTDLCIGSF